jgi:predicted enzyme related to lactoylglutathione lyase
MADPDSVHIHHGFDYIELPATDVDASARFYGEAFGWHFSSFGPGYLAIQTPDGRNAGGITQVGGPIEPALAAPMIVMFSRDLDASRQAVEDAGGVITREIFTFPGGRRFHFRDPAGNELGVHGFPASE